ncbi:MAG: SMP-30/gluconolactonase/LRE family protein [Phycisphaerae bacterium]|nr:SMP-30/gluconolactonase/LRE family protein [Phycisphaerae bacterium]
MSRPQARTLAMTIGLLPALLLVGASVLWPALSLAISFRAGSVASSLRAEAPVTTPPEAFLGSWALLGTSMLWSLLPALVATLVAWPLGIALATRVARGGGRTLLVLSALPVCLPGYLVFWSLWMAVGPGTAVGDAMMRADLVEWLRRVTLVFALVAWSVPFAAWTIAAWRLARPDTAERLRAIDGIRTLGRWRAAFRHDAPALVRGLAIATLALLAESVSFDLAQVRTYGYELRTLDATGGSLRDVVTLGWPGVAAVVAILAVATLAPGGRASRGSRLAMSHRALSRWPVVIALIAALPALMMLWRAASPHEAATFLRLYLTATTTSLLLALSTGALLAFAAMSLSATWKIGNRKLRLSARVVALAWLIAAAAPATIVAIGLESAWNRAGTAFVYDGALIVILGLIARFGAVAAVAASLAASLESLGTRSLRAVDAPVSWLWRWRLSRPPLVAAGVMAGALGVALGFSEVAVTARVRPPTIDVLATSTLNAIHYQQPETVLLGSAAAVALGGIASAIVVFVVFGRRRIVGLGLAVVVVAFVASCHSDSDVPPGAGGRAVGSAGAAGSTPPVPAFVTFGGPGFGKSQFHTPRTVAFDPTTRRFFIIDKEARVQRFDENGAFELEWRMPDWKNGRPVGISIHPDGRVFIADTHYYRILVSDQDGHELARFGSYGKELGQFIYPTDVAFGADGRLYVGEYGSNDRIQIFSADLKVISQFGTMGSGDNELSRPQELVFDRERDELYVADSNNHRIVVYDPEGRRLRQFGSAGAGRGELSYPRGIVLVGDGTVLVCEFGNHRVQHLDARAGDDCGKSLGIWGGTGAEPGRLQYPWDIAGVPGRIAVLDSGRDRVLIAPLPDARP